MLLKFVVFLMRFGDERQRSISIFPELEEVLISLASCRAVTVRHSRARIPELRQRVQRRQRIPAAMVEDILELRAGLHFVGLFQVSLSAHILRPKIAESLISAC